PELLTLRHGITRYRITLACFEAEHVAGAFRSSFYAAGRWLVPADLAAYPVSAPQRRLIHVLTQPGRQRRVFCGAAPGGGGGGGPRGGVAEPNPCSPPAAAPAPPAPSTFPRPSP